MVGSLSWVRKTGVGEEKEEPNVMLRIYNFICLNGSNSVTTKIKLKIKE